MALFDKLGDIARKIGDKANDMVETTKLSSKISSEKTAINDCMRQIGEYFYARHQAGEPDDPRVAELCAVIDEHNKTIADTQAEIARIQAENAAKAQAASEQTVQDAAPAVKGTCCPACGAANSPGTKFCQECGGKLEIFAPVEPKIRACPGCGAQVPTTSKFCGECGHRFE
jgi:uncharacterized small protein (DUF1192 family)